MNKIKAAFLLVIFLFGLRGMATAQKGEAGADLQRFIQLALKNNPGLRAQTFSAEASALRIPQAGALPDPVLTVAAMNLPLNSFAFDREPMSGKQIALMQKFPFPGKLGLKKSAARAGAEATKFAQKEYENQLVALVKKTYYGLFATDQLLEVTKKNLALLKQFIRIAETRYSVGKGLQQDILKAQVEYSKMQDRQITLWQKRQSLEARMNLLVNRPSTVSIPRISSIQLDSLRTNFAELEKTALSSRPFLKNRRATVQKSQRLSQLARKDALPDVSLGVAYTQRERLRNGASGIDYVSFVASFTLPVYFGKKQSKHLGESQLLLEKARQKLRDAENTVRFQIRDAWTQVQKNREQLRLLKEGILPQATQSLKAALAGYQVGKIDFLSLLNSQQTLFKYESDYYRAQAAYQSALADVEAIVGKSLFSKKIER